jgi:hypothetical protein
MLDCFQCNSYVPQINAAVYGLIHQRIQPTLLPVQRLLCVYEITLETGDVEVR